MEQKMTMKSASFLSHGDLKDFLMRLAREVQIWVPTLDVSFPHVVTFKPFQEGMEPDFQRLPVKSAKNVLFPQVEELLRFRLDKESCEFSPQTTFVEDTKEIQPTVLFGCRPCDARGFLVFDRSFLQGPFVDPVYKARREKNIVVSMVCSGPDSACFCGGVGSHPADTEGSDVQMIPINEGYVLHALTDKGQAFLEGIGNTATASQTQEAHHVREKARRSTEHVNSLTERAESFSKRFSDMAFWRFQTHRCLSCGVCTFVCPTCYCFTITDETHGFQGERLRSWDSCMFFHFTLEASGHNPRPFKAERFRNRIGHKFSYFPEKYGRFACCGCGRCLRHCPVAMDIRAIVWAMGETEEAHD